MDSNKCLQFALKNIKSALSSKDPKMKEIYIETAKNWLQDASSTWVNPESINETYSRLGIDITNAK